MIRLDDGSAIAYGTVAGVVEIKGRNAGRATVLVLDTKTGTERLSCWGACAEDSRELARGSKVFVKAKTSGRNPAVVKFKNGGWYEGEICGQKVNVYLLRPGEAAFAEGGLAFTARVGERAGDGTFRSSERLIRMSERATLDAFRDVIPGEDAMFAITGGDVCIACE